MFYTYCNCAYKGATKIMERGERDSQGEGQQLLAKSLIENQIVMKKHNVKSAGEAQRKYLELKTDRRDLRVKLDKF